jgi:hypothetical protein
MSEEGQYSEDHGYISQESETSFLKQLNGGKEPERVCKSIRIENYFGRLKGTLFRCKNEESQIYVIMFKEGWKGDYFHDSYNLRVRLDIQLQANLLVLDPIKNIYAIDPERPPLINHANV